MLCNILYYPNGQGPKIPKFQEQSQPKVHITLCTTLTRNQSHALYIIIIILLIYN